MTGTQLRHKSNVQYKTLVNIFHHQAETQVRVVLVSTPNKLTHHFLSRDKPRNAGRVSCRVCLEDFQCSINYLSEPVDVYNEWIDACETAN